VECVSYIFRTEDHVLAVMTEVMYGIHHSIQACAAAYLRRYYNHLLAYPFQLLIHKTILSADAA
jgi:hypothetical protein